MKPSSHALPRADWPLRGQRAALRCTTPTTSAHTASCNSQVAGVWLDAGALFVILDHELHVSQSSLGYRRPYSNHFTQWNLPPVHISTPYLLPSAFLALQAHNQTTSSTRTSRSSPSKPSNDPAPTGQIHWPKGSWLSQNSKRYLLAPPALNSNSTISQGKQRVYALLQQIPSGRVSSYAAMASALKSSPRAVGGALRRNPFAPEIVSSYPSLQPQ